ncbi:hypothetical protein GCM10007857_02510 [Bradyrhizobium iriomotense]|uniref:Uncharacterized protein n=1 Tax=Bradyrhizobium iriomotense TaxID=441950 RepID=A0ABQ6ATX7_9BRAD|nr:hypothetical protein GCM10007857_02510 [Bradyrhizobium iriomotense]
MPAIAGHHVQLGMTAKGRRLRQPESRLLPDERGFDDQAPALMNRYSLPNQHTGEIAIAAVESQLDVPVARRQRFDCATKCRKNMLPQTGRHA